MAKKSKDAQEISENALSGVSGGGPGVGEVARPMERPMVEPQALPRPPQPTVRPPVEVGSHFESGSPPRLEMPKPAPLEHPTTGIRPLAPELARPLLGGIEVNPEHQRRVQDAFSEVVPRPDLFGAKPSVTDSWRAPAHELEGLSRQIVQQKVNKDPGQVASDVAQRARSFLADSKSWWTGKSQAQTVLEDIAAKAEALTKKKEFTPSDKANLFAELDRLQAFERYHSKVSLGDAYVADFVQQRAGQLGLQGEAIDQLAKQAASKAFDPSRVSKNEGATTAAHDALSAYTEQLADRRFSSEALTNGDAFNRLVDSEPYAAYLYLQREARSTLLALEGQREYDLYGNLFEEPGLEGQIDAVREMSGTPFSDNASGLRDMRGKLEIIQRDAGLSMFKEGVADRQENAQLTDQLKQAAAQQMARNPLESTAVSRAKADPLRQLAQQNPIAAFEILQKRASAMREELGSGLGSYFRGDALAKLDHLANMSQTSFVGDGKSLPEKFEGMLKQLESLETRFSRAKSSEVAASVVAGSGDLRDVSVRAPLADKIKGSPEPVNVLPDLLPVLDQLPVYGARAQVDALNKRVQEQLRAKSLDSRAEDLQSGWPWWKKMLVGPSVDALVGAAKSGQFDAALSPQGINNVLSAVNRGIGELREPRATPADMARMEAEHKQNIADAAQRLTDLVLPSSWWNPIQGIKRLIVNYAARQALEGYPSQVVSSQSPLQRQLSALTGTDLSRGTAEEQMARKLAVSRLMSAATAELARPAPHVVEGPVVATRNQEQIQQLLTQLNLPGAIGLNSGIDPNTWKGWALGKASGFAQENVRARSEESARLRDTGQQKLLQFWREFRTQNPIEANLPQLQGFIENHDYRSASDLIRMEIADLVKKGRDEHLDAWQNMLQFTDRMQHLAPMSETISKAYDGLVTNGIAPWLRGQTIPPS